MKCDFADFYSFFSNLLSSSREYYKSGNDGGE